MEELKSDELNQLSYEEMMTRLEQIIARMDSGNVPLEESLRAFNEGMALIQAARNKLDAYRIKIEETAQEEQ